MIINMQKILRDAEIGHYAVPQFNINNLEWTRFILEECEVLKTPVILGVSEGATRYMGGFHTVYNLVEGLINDLNITVPVCLHLDHGSCFENCIKAIDNGFTSVMIDASKYNIDDNIKITKQVVDYAHLKNVTVEAEVGAVGGEEDGVANELAYAKVEDAVKIVKETNVDFVAPALGSVHGIYKGEPKLDFERMIKIHELIKRPLVLHGGSGIPDELIKKAISCGICKININTELQIAWSHGVRELLKIDDKVYDPRKIIKAGEKKIKEMIRSKVILFGSNNRA